MITISGNGRYLLGSFHRMGGVLTIHLNRLTAHFATDAKSEVPTTVVEPNQMANQVAHSKFRKGAGGRASFSGNVVTVFGANGMLGRALVNRLAKFGNQIIIPYRCDPYWVRELKSSGDLGQILFFPFNLKDEDAIRKAVKYSNIVVNLIGTRVKTKNYSMYETHEYGARRIARICRETGVQRLIHVSAMGADPDYQSRTMKKADFLRSKGLGELAVRQEFPDATIVRPSVMFGELDQFIWHYLTHSRKSYYGWVRVYKCGEETYKMPIFRADVSIGINHAIQDPTSAGKVYEFVGPHNYKLAELLTFMYKKARVVPRCGHYLHLHDHWDPQYALSKFICINYGRMFKRYSRLNDEWIEYLEGSTDFLSGSPTIGDLGVTHLAEFENAGGHQCIMNSFMRQYEERYLEFDVEPRLPIRSPPIFRGDQLPLPVSQPLHRKFFLTHAFVHHMSLPFREMIDPDDERVHPRTMGGKTIKTAHLENF